MNHTNIKRFCFINNIIFALFLIFAITLPIPTRSHAAPDNTPAVPSLPQEANAPISAAIGADQPSYHATADRDGFHVDNAQGLSAHFTSSGVDLYVGEYNWGLSLASYGYGETLQPVASSKPTAHDNRIEYYRGNFTEWYVNGPFGLEQGFTLAAPPGRSGGPLTLALSMSGDLNAAVDKGGKELSLSASEDTALLRYTGLMAYDADGRELATWLEIQSDTQSNSTPLFIRVNDTGAHYPLTIDPFFQKAKLTASDKDADNYFGQSIAVSGDVVVVGAHYADAGGTNGAGAAYVFVKPVGGWGRMTQTAKLTASDKRSNDWFGWSVAISGDVVVIGSPNADSSGKIQVGAAYVFIKPGGGWVDMTQTAKLSASDKVFGDFFGVSVAISGNVIVVGAPYADLGGTSNAGATYVFIKPSTGWVNRTQTAKLTTSDKAAGDLFGYSVAISDGVVVVGAVYADLGGTTDAGAAYVFVKPVSGWGDMTQTAKLTASDKAMSDYFGQSVSVSGDVVVVGAFSADPGGKTDAGAAYVFVKPETGWMDITQNARLTASDKASDNRFGSSVSVSGNVVVVGAPWAAPGGTDYAGAAYIFVKLVSGWGDMTQTAKLTASDKAVSDYFGNSVAISGTVVTVGAPMADLGVRINAGTAYLFDGKSSITFRSQSAYDGNILESSEYSSVGGWVNSTDTTFRIGDDELDRQYRSLLSFNTSSLPDNSVITSVIIKIKKQGIVGTDPFTTHKPLYVDIRKPYFGTAVTLAAHDFQAAASKGTVGTFGNVPISNWYSVTLNNTAYPYINLTGTTQFRLRFNLDDDNDTLADYMKFFSGNAGVSADKPLLIIQYYVP